VGHTDPRPYYQRADVFVFPSIEEGSALVTYEALAYGLPVVTTFNAGSVVEEGEEGFIVPIRDPNALAERLEVLFKDESLRKKMSEKASAKAKVYTWERYGDNLARFYEEVLK
jgi:glycosyltransferase involved in cell wall biosynthesis